MTAERGFVFSEAVIKGDLDAIKSWIKEGGDINGKDGHGLTPLMWAARAGEIEILRYLAAEGAHLDTRDGRGRTALSHAAGAGRMPEVRALYKLGLDPDKTMKEGDITPLFASVAEGRENITDWLLKKGANPDVIGPDGTNPFFYASRRQDFDLMEKLLDYGADPSLAEFSGVSPLHAAVLGRRHALLKRLLKAGADPDFVSVYHNQPPLTLAAQRNDLMAVNILLENGADPDRQDPLHNTPLHAAIRSPNAQIVHSLLKAGANFDAQNRDGLTPYDLAVVWRKPHIRELMKNAAKRMAIPGQGKRTPGRWPPRGGLTRP